MKGKFKFILAIVGWVFGRGDGAVAGFLIGAVIDSLGWSSAESEHKQSFSFNSGYFHPHLSPEPAQNFQFCLIALSAVMLQSDGSYNDAKYTFIKKFLVKQFGESQIKKDMHVLGEMAGKYIPVNKICAVISTNMNYNGRLQLLHYLFGIGCAGGSPTNGELRTIEQIAFYWGINTSDFSLIKEEFMEKDNSRYFDVLGVNSDASNEEIKKAYRRMALKYHPDSVTYLGDKARIEAEEKFKNIAIAYQAITKERNIV